VIIAKSAWGILIVKKRASVLYAMLAFCAWLACPYARADLVHLTCQIEKSTPSSFYDNNIGPPWEVYADNKTVTAHSGGTINVYEKKTGHTYVMSDERTITFGTDFDLPINIQYSINRLS
jgi:hypothetical protein